MTCAKLRVFCKITTADGQVFNGENTCQTPQTSCPRLPGEGYAKCKSICNQDGHAEIVALEEAKKANANLIGATAEIIGQFYVCKDCAAELKKAGVSQFTVIIK